MNEEDKKSGPGAIDPPGEGAGEASSAASPAPLSGSAADPDDAAPVTASPAEAGAPQPAPPPPLWESRAPLVEEDPLAGPSPKPDPLPADPAPVVGAKAGEARRGGGGGFIAALLGGAIAAIAGFALSHYDLLNLRADSAAGEARLAALEKGLTDAKAGAGAAADQAAGALARVEELSASAGAGAEAALSAYDAKLAGLETKLTALSQAAPDGSVPPAAFATLQSEVAALKSALESGAGAGPTDPAAIRRLVEEELNARAADVTAKAEAEASALREQAQREAALNALVEAVDNGQPYSAALSAYGLDPVPEALASHAGNGIPALADLAADFPDAARLALEASLKTAGAEEGLGARAWSLLRIGTGARSLTPRAGSDPDAVLSRAEAAVKAGDLTLALSEIEALPEAGKAAMQAWATAARARLAAAEALATLSAPSAQ